MSGGAIPRFEAPRGLRNAHLQTIAARLRRGRVPARYARTRIDTEDGDFVDIDVWPTPDEPVGICLLLHGLEGSARSGYMVSTSAALAAAGVRAVALNFRSCGGEPNRLPRAYHSGDTGDIERALAWVSRRWPGRPIAAVGFSLGGNALLNLLGRRGTGRGAGAGGGGEGGIAGGDRQTGADGLVAAVAVSVPYDLAACAAALEDGLNRLYAARFLRGLRAKAREKAARFPDRIAPEAAAARTLREFDDRLTAPLHGFRDAADYYERCSSAQFAGSLSVPTLLVHAADDPIAPIASMPLGTLRQLPRVSLALTKRGGHLGFLDRRLGTGPEGWLERVIADYVSAALATVGGSGGRATVGGGSRAGADNAGAARIV